MLSFIKCRLCIINIYFVFDEDEYIGLIESYIIICIFIYVLVFFYF